MDRKRSEEVAANRLQVILPLIDPSVDPAKRLELKEEEGLCLSASVVKSEKTQCHFHSPPHHVQGTH